MKVNKLNLDKETIIAIHEFEKATEIFNKYLEELDTAIEGRTMINLDIRRKSEEESGK